MADQEALQRLRSQFQHVYLEITACHRRILAWFEEAKATEPTTTEVADLVKEILVDEFEYRSSTGDVPRVDSFTDEELKYRTGNVERLSNIGEEMIRLGTAVELKLMKLRYLLAGNQLQ
jgi:hypothetical protein